MNTLPDSLVGFRDELLHAVRRDAAAAPPRRRRVALRLAVSGAAAAAVALGVLGAVSGNAPSVVAPASAQSVVRQAAAALAVAPGSVLHVSLVVTQHNPDGSTVSWRNESWQQESAPYDRRQIQTDAAGSVESGSANGDSQLYDAARNTIYSLAPKPDAKETARYEITPGATAGTFVLHLRTPALYKRDESGKAQIVPGTPTTLTITAAQAQGLRSGADVVEWTVHGERGATPYEPRVVPAPKETDASPDPDSSVFRDQVLSLLRSGRARVAGTTTIAGQDAVEIDSADGTTQYYVAADGYAPLRIDTHGIGGGTSLRVLAYETLSADSAPLSLAAQHPTARIDRNPDDFRAALARLFPHG
ncbi:MAG TPA: hypothetical protein VFJ77_02590 [Gaiellaceae bacterium]|nr:hypothetical protein [Gaiellaceae bacterium]